MLSDELRLLKWQDCPLPFFPRSFQLNNLVRLEMSFSHLKQLWHGRMYFEKLRYFIVESKDLTEIPDFNGAPYLEEITFSGCTSLRKVHSSIGKLRRLQSLCLSSCGSLEELSKEISWESLKELDLKGCSRLKKLPDLSSSPNISNIVLSNCESLRELHPSIGNLKWLRSLPLSFCKSLEELPVEANWEPLEELYLRGCLKLKELPNLSGVPNLKRIDLSNCESLRKLHPSIGNLQQLQYLSLSFCKSLKELPEEINWESLEDLDLRDCLRLKELPNLSRVPNIKRINLSNCESLKKLHPSIGNLQQLQYLFLSHCKSLKKISKEINCKSLEQLYLNECLSLKKFPKLGGNTTALWRVDLRGAAIKRLPLSFQKLSSLQQLLVGGTEAIQAPRDILCGCTGFCSDENEFTRLTDNFCLLYNLRILCLSKCRRLQALPKLPSNLTWLDVTESPLLEMIYDQRDTETTWKASDAYFCLWFSATSINGHDVTPYKIIQLRPPCPKVEHRWVQSTVSWGPTTRFEIPEWFQQRSTGLFGKFQSRVNEDLKNWLGYALFVVYEVHEHGFPEFVCQFHAGEQPLVLRVPEARSVGENGFWAFLSRNTFANAFRHWDLGTKEHGFSIISNSLKAEIKECGARVVYSSEESEFFHVLRSISQHGLELKEFDEFWFVLVVGCQSEK